mgnify:CR=1 FL=1
MANAQTLQPSQPQLTPDAVDEPKPVLQTVDPTTTTEGLISKISTSGSPLMQQAETSARQGMNSRGLINSSMAIGEGQKAVYNAALPIAQQDSQLHASVAKSNQDATNQFGLNKQSFGFNTQMADQAQKNNLETIGVNQANTQANMATTQANTQTNMGTEQTYKLATMAADAGFKEQYSAFQNVLDQQKDDWQQAQKIELNEILTSEKIAIDLKGNYITGATQLMTQFQSGLQQLNSDKLAAAPYKIAYDNLVAQRDASMAALKNITIQAQGWDWT